MHIPSPASPVRHRGFASVRAEGGPDTPLSLIQQINTAVTDMRARNDRRYQDLENAVNSQQEAIAALRMGGAIHPAAGIRGPGAPFPALAGDVAETFFAQMRGEPRAAMTTQSNPDGGFTVDRQVDNVLNTILRDISPMRTLARVVPVTTGDGWDRVVTQTGSQSYWAGEEDTRSETASPKLGRVSIIPGEVYAIPSLTNQLLEDSSFDLNAFLAEDVGGEFAVAEGTAFITGNGINKPKGFLTYPVATAKDSARAFGTLQYTATGAAGAFSTNGADILCDLMTSLRASYRAGDGVAWLMNSATANMIRKFKDSQGNYLWTASIVAGQPDRLLGYPVAIDEGMPDIAANAFAVAFGNWRRGYAVVDKPGLRLIVDKVTRKGWTQLYFSRRVGGGVVDSNAIKLLKFSAS